MNPKTQPQPDQPEPPDHRSVDGAEASPRGSTASSSGATTSRADANGERRRVPADGDRVLLERAAAGDEQAVRALYRTHVAKLQRQAARVLGANDPDVEDVVQQSFLAALDGAVKFDGRSSVQTWLFGIVTRRALDAARARYRRQRFARFVNTLGFHSDVSAAPDTSYHAGVEAERLLAMLSPLQRTVFVLHDVEGYTFAEISGLIDVGISTLHGRLIAARKRLDAFSGDESGGEVEDV